MRRADQNKIRRIIDFIAKHVNEKGFPPSVREICKGASIKSTSSVHFYLHKLVKEGLISMDPSKTRAIKLLEPGKKACSINYSLISKKELVDVPIVGKVAAGQPILAVENIEDTFPLPVDYVSNAKVFMLKVSGDSMIEAGILDGDLVLVKQQRSAANGQIVVALIDDEATIKTYYREKNHIRLQPENSALKPILIKGNVTIVGKVSGVFRKL